MLSVMGWELVVYDPIVAKSRSVRNNSNDGGNVGVENVIEEPFLNDDQDGSIEDIDDSDEFDSILWFKRTAKTVP